MISLDIFLKLSNNCTLLWIFLRMRTFYFEAKLKTSKEISLATVFMCFHFCLEWNLYWCISDVFMKILWDRIMNYRILCSPNYDKLNYPFCSLKWLPNEDVIRVPKVFNPTNKRMCYYLQTSVSSLSDLRPVFLTLYIDK